MHICKTAGTAFGLWTPIVPLLHAFSGGHRALYTKTIKHSVYNSLASFPGPPFLFFVGARGEPENKANNS